MDVVALEKTEVYQGRYRVERTLGAGGMGVVYLAEDVKLGRKVAIKQLRSDMTGNSAEARFRSEAQLLARLNHPNIVRLYDVLEEDHNIALVMELVEGVTLKEWMREHSATLAEKLDLLMQICQGLGKAHCLGIIHRDLKPENILVTYDGVAKITDFGIAKALDCDQQLTREDHIAGSVQAMSPEQLQGAPLDARSDLFSLGSIAYELLCGHKPFERGDKSALAFAQQITSKPHIPPQQAWPEIPKPLAALLDRLLAKRPEQRPESAERVYAALELVRKHGIDLNTQQYSETVTQLLIKPRKKSRRIATALFSLIPIGGLVFWGWQYFIKLPPQYIAVLPVEFSGNIRGEANDVSLVTTMIRQALLRAPTHLKSSALISYLPEEGLTLEQHLKHLKEKGVTDALLGRLNCTKKRCNAELQRIDPSNGRVKRRKNFDFLSLNESRWDSQLSAQKNVTELFPEAYNLGFDQDFKMEPEDFDIYLSMAEILNKPSELVKDEDLEKIEEQIIKYPDNIYLYSLFTEASVNRYRVTGNNKLLSKALTILSSAESTPRNQAALLHNKLVIKSLGNDKKGFESTLKQLQKLGYPSAELFLQHARFLYMQGDHKNGLIYAEKAYALNPNGETLYTIAVNQVSGANYVAAKSTLEKMIKIYPEKWVAFSLLGVVELELGNLEKAEKAITTIPEENRTWRTKSNLATSLFLQGKYHEALKNYMEIQHSTPDNILILSQIAEVSLMLSNKTQSNKYFIKVLALTDTESDRVSKRYKAQALAYLGETAKSINLITDLLRETPDDTFIQYTAAQVYALAGELQSASYHLERLLAQGMGAEWFILPPFQSLCNEPQASNRVKDAICFNRANEAS
ncbi:serine/threonine-protein kinase [Microbulbifer variabilis]|uniref:serine/threonine-protein kinase n=1 Tax=Microbulbifer variabilis TaxID=266805 RepID=UPI001CFCE034|nr:serine/threonine-protein kinase [Microbulbifer variabilis]